MQVIKVRWYSEAQMQPTETKKPDGDSICALSIRSLRFQIWRDAWINWSSVKSVLIIVLSLRPNGERKADNSFVYLRMVKFAKYISVMTASWSFAILFLSFLCYYANFYNVLNTAAGSVLEAMAKAIEKAAVVLVCMSQKYQDSPSCRTGEKINY